MYNYNPLYFVGSDGLLLLLIKKAKMVRVNGFESSVKTTQGCHYSSLAWDDRKIIQESLTSDQFVQLVGICFNQDGQLYTTLNVNMSNKLVLESKD